VSWRTIKAGGPEGGCLEIGALLFPEHRGRGVGTAAQRLLVEYLFATTLANRLQAITDVETWPSSGRWSGSGSAVRVCCAAWPSSVGGGETACCTPGYEATRPEQATDSRRLRPDARRDLRGLRRGQR
jgi:hypothetical protein